MDVVDFLKGFAGSFSEPFFSSSCFYPLAVPGLYNCPVTLFSIAVPSFFNPGTTTGAPLPMPVVGCFYAGSCWAAESCFSLSASFLSIALDLRVPYF
jgi:hypothetical protein